MLFLCSMLQLLGPVLLCKFIYVCFCPNLKFLHTMRNLALEIETCVQAAA